MTILTDYTWTGKFKPFAHQKETSDFLSRRRKAFCFNEQGTGKTASVISVSYTHLTLPTILRV